ncbi:protein MICRORCHIDIA 4-like [Humulus lupulus]|uniref:protein MICRORCHIDIA 4-like n=1 Tax=Humulus lupulus TaxID=3486 RepID=UPI002B4148F6|nr:protein MICRORCHIDIA 4-like [Humulus lupulus]
MKVKKNIDYEKRNGEWRKLLRTSERIWNKNLSTIVNWSPYSTEQELLQQINCMLDHGTKVIIYNLWEDEEEQLELDFDTDPLDIQIRGINRDERMISMVQQFPNSKHFLTYQHSLRSYASILYLRLPTQFRIYLRGLEVKHHNMINDMMLIKEMTYKPQIQIQNSMLRQAVSNVTIGFVKDAHHHIDVQGFNVYHKNRLIKPFWRVWNPAGSDGRGVIGVLEANFVEPSHDKQGFERTTVLSRLESRLLFMQKNYWRSNCGRVGYAARRVVDDQEHIPTNHNGLVLRSSPAVNANLIPRSGERSNGASNSLMEAQQERPQASVTDEKAQPQDTAAEGAEYAASKEKPHDTESKENTLGQETASKENVLDQETASEKRPHETASKERAQETASEERAHKMTRISSQVASTSEGYQIKMEEVKGNTMERSAARNAVYMKLELKYVSTCQNERCKSLKLELEETKEKMMNLDKEQSKLIGILLEERTKGEMEEDRLKNSLMEANKTISALTEKVAELERVIHTEAKLKKSEDSVTMLPS